MKQWYTLLVLIIPFWLFAQEKENEPVYEQQLENQAALDENSTEDDSHWQQLEFLRSHKLNLNKAGKNDLEELQLLSAIQIENFLRYRSLLGLLINIYELQAIPGWDIDTIRKLLPYITIAESEAFDKLVRNRLAEGERLLLIRVAQVLEKSKGFTDTTGAHYLGGRTKLLFRYSYRYKNLLQYGITGDKDAGEQFFKGKQSMGFDFYSFHFFLRKAGKIQSLALGDFTANLGQGLIQWQSLAFKKSASVLEIKRQAAVLKPYNSAGEFNFYRGAGITLQYKKWETTFFGSLRRLSTNWVTDSSNNQPVYISSLITTGYHRTISELTDRNNTTHIAAGGNVKYRFSNGHIAMNGVMHHFAKPLGNNGEPYDIYSITGDRWSNYSIDYSYTLNNMHVFGELAVDKKSNRALLQGLLINLDAKTSMSLVYRNINKAYQSFFSNAFTENSAVTNESGLYAALSMRPAYGWRIDAYADHFRFPWLKFRADAPGYGYDYLLQVTYTPNKQTELYSRFKMETKPINIPGAVVQQVQGAPKLNWRTQISYAANREVIIRNRVELLWYNNRGNEGEKGFLWFGDIQYKPLLKSYSVAARLLYVETGGYNSRIYAYENSGLYSFSIPAFYDKGTKCFVNLDYRLRGKKVSCILAIHIGQSFYPLKPTIGSALDAITGNRKTEIKAQLILTA